MKLNRLLYSKLYSEESGGESSGGGSSEAGTVIEAPAATPAPAESGTVLDGGQDGQGNDIVNFGDDGYKYAGKFDSAQDLENGYSESVAMHTKKMGEMNEKLKGFVGAPESGEYTLPDGADGYSDSVLGAISEWGNENGLSQDSYADVLNKISQAEAADMEAYKAEQVGLLGKDAEARIQNINDKWTATYGNEARDWMNSKALSAADVEMFESILAQGGGTTVNPSGTQVQGSVMITREQLSEAMFAKDGAGMLKMQSDPEYKARVDQMTEKFNTQRAS